MSRPRHHVIVNLEGGWSVTADGAARAKRRFQSEHEAIQFARQLAQAMRGDVYFHRADGSEREKLRF